MSYQQLTAEERYQIYVLLKAGHKQKSIAKLLNRHPSTISRELSRNRGLRGYRPKQAQRLNRERRMVAYKHRKLTPEVIDWVVKLLEQDLSPEQISGYLAIHKHLSICHETIYRLIYANKATGGQWYLKLRHVSKGYRKRYGSYQQRGQLVGRVSIEERPDIVDN